LKHRFIKKYLLAFIRFYQKTAWFHKPIFKALFMSDQACRFTPTCSDYCYQAIDKYGMIKGTWICLKRVCKCNPWFKGGYDPLN
jgi:putative membrane protein insertion efficiency factor